VNGNIITTTEDVMEVFISDQKCLDHWAEVRARIAAGQPASPNAKPASTLYQQAQKQIARLEKEIKEWRAIVENNKDP